ncbi:DUF4349 domain-containing protein [Halobaculum gomorrense]|uniref:DUF4349 domain-containing protein n=1 Tax=Halobaculum gomorrense TaxID=43928 RepID=A0A1M5MWW8_9EURY|nr:DUF4349 domain-containing protein [Halobaculum gomorrense]SHG81602.1 protein of unknown function [Halobaculum gomorrense]
MRRGPLVTVCCALLVVLAGCAGGDGADGAGGGSDLGATARPEAAEATAAAGGAADGAGGAAVNAQVANRAIIYEATVELTVDDYGAARENLTALARERGGYVEQSTQEVRGEGNETWTVGRIVLRIPSGNYSGAVERIRSTGELRSFHESTQRVGDRIVDLEARLKSLRAERERLRELYERANDTEDVLAVQRELSDVQTEIERTQARLTSLQRRVAYSTVTVELREPRPDYEPPERSAWYETPLTGAFLQSVDGVVVLGRGAVVLAAYALPYLLVLAVPAAGVALGYRRARRRRRR